MFFLLGACANPNVRRYVGASERVIEYQLDGNQHAVVVAMDGISAPQARQIARQRAAEIAVELGDRYFTIDSEEQTRVVKSEDRGLSDQQSRGNLYHELIIEGNFSRRQSAASQAYPAIRLVFTSYKQKPSLRAIDACTLTDCK